MAADFNVTIPVFDGKYGSVDVNIIGQADISGTDEEFAKIVIETAIMEAAGEITDENKSYLALADNKSRLEAEISASLQKREIPCSGVTITGADLTQKSREYVEDTERLKEAAAMSPEEIAKKMEEAARAAQEMVDRLTPEERQRAEEEAKKLMQENEKKYNDIMAKVQSGLENNRPKFCPNCGAPNNGGNFCTNCGSKF